MSPTHDSMLARFRAGDPESDGRFLAGAAGTGTYCLPSCGARTPPPADVRFFATEDEARAAGLRPCPRCRPDRFYRRFDPDLALAEGVAAEVRRDPGSAGDAASLAARAGVDAARLNALFRRHFHRSASAFLLDARAEAACRALAGGAGVSEAGFGAGWASLSAFHHAFRRRTGLSPGESRALGEGSGFVLALPEGFRADVVLGYLGRDPASPVERVRGAEVAKALLLDGTPAVLRIAFEAGAARCAVDRPVAPAGMRAAHAAAVRMLGLAADPAAFERRVGRRPELARLIGPRCGLRIPLTADAWECLLWTICGQQVNLAFAYALRRTVVELAGVAVDGMRAHPAPAAVAALDYGELTARRFSRRKAEYVIDTARLVASGALALDPHASATATERRLLGVRGLGPWSVQYFLMRGGGFADCVPVGDAALTAALQRFFRLDARPDAAATRALMEPFAPFRSLATFHLWQTPGDPV